MVGVVASVKHMVRSPGTVSGVASFLAAICSHGLGAGLTHPGTSDAFSDVSDLVAWALD